MSNHPVLFDGLPFRWHSFHYALSLAASTTLVSIQGSTCGESTNEAHTHENVFRPAHLTTLSCSSNYSIVARKHEAVREIEWEALLAGTAVDPHKEEKAA